MAKTSFIGAGISAYFSQLFHWKSGDLCVYPPSQFDSDIFFRRKNIEIQKILGPKSYSFGTVKYYLDSTILHDRNKIGGNSEIWGGFFDLDGDSRTHFGMCMINTTSAIAGIEFKAATNNIQSGDIAIYGLKT